MTLELQARDATYLLDGVTTTFAVGFKFFKNEDLDVYILDRTTGALIKKALLTTDYTVSGVGKTAGGSITFLSVTDLAADRNLFIERQTQGRQSKSLKDLGRFPGRRSEDMGDELAAGVQDARALAARGVLVPVNDAGVTLPPASQRALKILSFDATGLVIDMLDLTSGSGGIIGPQGPAGAVGPQGPTGAGGTVSLPSVLALRAFAVPTAEASIELIGDLAANDGGSGTFYFDPNSATPDDGLFTIKPDAVTGNGRFVRKIENGKVSLAALGAKNDGTDIAPLLQTALSASAATIVIPKAINPWSWKTTVNAVEGVKLEIEGEISHETPPDVPAYYAAGSEGVSVLVTAPITAGDFAATITAGDEAGFAENGWCRVFSGDVIDPDRTGTTQAELRRIKTVASGLITVDAPFEFSYATTVKIVPVTMFVRPVVTGHFKINGSGVADSDRLFAKFFLCVDPIIENFQISRADDRAVWIEDCVGGGVFHWNCTDTQTAGTGYGVSVVGCSYGIRVHHWTTSDVRHAVSTNNVSTRGGAPSVDVGFGLILGSPLLVGTGGVTDPIKTHAATLKYDLHHVTIMGGTNNCILIESPFASIENVKCVGSDTAASILLAQRSNIEAEYTIRDVELNHPFDEGIKVFTGAGANTARIKFVDLDGVRIRGGGNTANMIQIGFEPTKPIGRVSLRGVWVLNSKSTTHGIYIADCDTVRVIETNVLNFKNTGLRIGDGVKRCLIDGYNFESGGVSTEGIYISGTAKNVTIKRSVLDGKSNASSKGVLIDASVTNTIIDDSVEFIANITNITGEYWPSGRGIGGFVTVAGSTPTVTSGSLFTTIGSTAGTYFINFKNPVPDIDYDVVGFATGNGGGSMHASSIAKTGFLLALKDATGGASDSSFKFSVIPFAR
ncbi:MAG: hypothetical protein COA84_07515 [Robiginitomaculum sp.]|nr:MAG: hypothetical protein COA84_07515 [Robiginitomaculum sp.]